MKTSALLMALAAIPCLAACSVAEKQSSVDADADASIPVRVGHGVAFLGHGVRLLPGDISSAVTPSGVTHSESCAGEAPITLSTSSGEVHVAGSTTSATDDQKIFCGDPDASTSAPDVTYPLVLTEACSLKVSISGQNGFDPAFELRTVCDVEGNGSPYYCINGVNALDLSHAFAAGTYYLVVDGQNGMSGDFDLTLSCSSDICGDGSIGPSEQCDSGLGTDPNDGCGDPGNENACQIEATAASDTCATVEPTPVKLGQDQKLPSAGPPYSTIGASADYLSTDPDYPVLSPDQVFGFTAADDGTIKITVGMDSSGSPFCFQTPFPAGCWNHMIYVREDDCEGGTQIAEAAPDFDSPDADGNVQVVFPATAGHTYYLFVSGTDMTEYDIGPYFLQVAME